MAFPTDGPWLDASIVPQAATGTQIPTGAIVELLTESAPNVPSGTALFQVLGSYASDQLGVFLEGTFGGCSLPTLAPLLSRTFPKGRGYAGLMGSNAAGSGHAVLHCCTSAAGTCPAVLPGRPHVMHFRLFRLRAPHLVAEPWADRGVIAPSSVASAAAGSGGPVPAPEPDAGDPRVLKQRIEELKERLAVARGEGPLAARLARAARAHSSELHSRRKRRRHRSGETESVSDADDDSFLFASPPPSRYCGSSTQELVRKHLV